MLHTMYMYIHCMYNLYTILNYVAHWCSGNSFAAHLPLLSWVSWRSRRALKVEESFKAHNHVN